MSSLVYNITAVVTVPAGAACPSESALKGTASASQGNVAPGTFTFTPISDIAPASTSRPATLYSNLTLAAAAGPPPAQITALVTYYGPLQANANASYTSIGTEIITASNPGAFRTETAQSSASSSAASSGSSTGNSTNNASTASSTSSTSSNSSTAVPGTSPSPSKNYGAGAVAGAAVGCAIGGILIGCLIAFLLLKRRRRNDSRRSNLSTRELAPSKEHGEAIYLGAGSKGAWASHLPQPESDGTIRAAVSRTLDQIEMHVENFYVDNRPSHLNVDAQAAVEDFDSPHLPGSVLSLLPTTNRPTLLIKHCLTNLILSRIDPDVATNSTFLPRYMTSLQTSPAKRSQPGRYYHWLSYEQKLTPSDSGFAQAFSQWRVLSSYLRQPPENDRSYLAERDQAITVAARNFGQAFEPWARSDENTRIQSLVGIMKRASDLGILITSQPSTFHWQWDSAGTSSKPKGVTQIVILPGLYKLTDQSASPLSPPLHLSEPRMEPLSRS